MNTFIIPVPAMTVRHTVAGRRTIGLRIDYHEPGQIPDLLRQLERRIYLHCGQTGFDPERPGVVLLGIVMPCGQRYMFRTCGDIPQESLPCDCGDSDHWVLLYNQVEARVQAEMWP